MSIRSPTTYSISKSFSRRKSSKASALLILLPRWTSEIHPVLQWAIQSVGIGIWILFTYFDEISKRVLLQFRQIRRNLSIARSHPAFQNLGSVAMRNASGDALPLVERPSRS